MNIKFSAIIALIISGLTFGAFYPSEVPYEERESLILHGVINFIKQAHVNPKPIDDDFSKAVFKMYLERIDAGKRFLIQSDVDKLAVNELIIDDQVNARTLEYFDVSLDVLNNGVARGERIFNDLINNHDFDFDKSENIELDNDKKVFAKSEEELKDVWRKYLKYDIVQKYNRKKNIQKAKIEAEEEKKLEEKFDKTKKKIAKEIVEDLEDEGVEIKTDLDEPLVIKTDAELLADAKEDTKENFTDWFERLNKLRRSDRFETYLGAITNYFDPHTDYFNPKEKQDFDINMGGKLEGIGARLLIADDQTEVSSIVPGGPAHLQGELEAGDIIIALTQEGEETIDISGWRSDDVIQKVRGKKGTTVVLTVKKKDGTIKDISILRDRVIIDQSFARSVLLDLPGTANNIGYIKLPKFYSSFENEDGNSCAKDVAAEIEKLKGSNVNGIILDLRNNTGGSLADVVDMTGLFIEEGPIVQVKPRARKAYVHSDTDSKVQYDGPLIVMTNHLSASASEILAAALQDYGRAIIVGSNSTFGKGSVQRFFDLDRAFTGNDEMKPLGNLKISMQKFYRVDGGSTQLKGVTPDIILPDNYHFIETGEKEYENALEWTEIEKEEYDQNVVEIQNKSKIAELSRKRVELDDDFKLILENAQRLKDNRDFSNYPISLGDYEALIEKRKEAAKKFENLMEDDVQYLKVENMPVDTAYIHSDESRVARNDVWIKALKKDIYLEETLFIIRDLINMEESYSMIEEKFKKSEKKDIKP